MTSIPSPHHRTDVPGLASRKMALQLLDGVLRQHRGLDDMFGQVSTTLTPRDRAFVQLLVLTVLRRKAVLEEIIDRFVDKPLPAKYRRARLILLLGAVQLLCLDTDSHAAVSLSVELAERERCRPVKGLINAVLRRISQQRENLSATLPDGMMLPDWLREPLIAAYGGEKLAQTERQLLQPAPLDISVKHNVDEWADRLGGMVLGDQTVRLHDGGEVQALAGYAEGEWWVQDVVSSLPVQLVHVEPGMRVLDMCAAPGGKTAQLAAQGAKVVALDRSAKRLARLDENMQRLGLSVTVHHCDASQYMDDTGFDVVLLDAPCSATGILRRHPDIAYTKQPDDVLALMQAQQRLLTHSLSLVNSGGVLLYCTCSLLPEEGEQQIDAFLSQYHDRVAPIAFTPMPGIDPDIISPKGFLRSLPHYLADHGGMDGFFAAAMRVG